ncbi:unnamed protein product [Gadus morhua 'NCC']
MISHLFQTGGCELSFGTRALEEVEHMMGPQSDLRTEGVRDVGVSLLSECVILGNSQLLALRSEGDVIIGGLFPVHYLVPNSQNTYNSKPQNLPCNGFDDRAFRWMMTMIFAVEEINRNPALLPGVTLGYHIMDSCDHIHTSLNALLSLLTHSTNRQNTLGEDRKNVNNFEKMRNMKKMSRTIANGGNKEWENLYFPDDDRMSMRGNVTITKSTTDSGTCLTGSPITAVIGLASSSPTGAIAHILGPFSIPLVSYFATCVCLTDKHTYPSFLRTVPSDLFQVRGLVELVKFFGWNWVGTVGTPVRLIVKIVTTINSNPTNPTFNIHADTTWVFLIHQDDYSRYGIQAFSHQFRQLGGCLAYHLTIPQSPTFVEIGAMADTLQSSKAKVVVAFATEGQLLELFSEVPVSLCSDPCPPGSRQARRPGEPQCCFDCLPCAEGEISNQTDSTECTKCPEYYWSDKRKVECVAGVDDFLSVYDTMGIILITLTLLGVVMTTVITTVFHHFRTTPIVRANNSEISFLLLVSLKLCFLCSLAFIGKPSTWTCRLRQAAFGVSFVLCLSCLLVKTIVVLLAFRSTGPGSGAMKLFGPAQQRTLILCTTAPQVCLCAGWLSAAPPFPFRNPMYQASTGKIVVECRELWPAGFYLVLGYIGLLASLCLLLAYLGRKLPDTFNEAKLITFSMIIFCAVWLSFIPAHVSSPGKFTVAVEIFAILASSFGMETRELRFSRAMAFAINEINNSSDLLPGVALGYKIHDSCASTPMAVQLSPFMLWLQHLRLSKDDHREGVPNTAELRPWSSGRGAQAAELRLQSNGCRAPAAEPLRRSWIHPVVDKNGLHSIE